MADVYINSERTIGASDLELEDLLKRMDSPSDLIFSIYSINQVPNPNSVYVKLLLEFQKLLKAAGMDERKEGTSKYKRRKITLHSFRRFVKTVISNQVNQDYSEWFLGHSKSPYYTIKEQERKRMFTEKCMKYLTFLDYTTLDAAGKSVEAKLSEKDQEIEALKKKMAEMESMMHTIGEKLEVKLIKASKRH